MTITEEQRAELRKLASAADGSGNTDRGDWPSSMTVATYSSCFTDEDSRFVASISPETIISLLDALDDAERSREWLTSMLESAQAESTASITRAEGAERERDDLSAALHALAPQKPLERLSRLGRVRARVESGAMLDDDPWILLAEIAMLDVDLVRRIDEVQDEARADIARIASVLLEPVTLPDGAPPLVDRIVGAIEQLYRERTDARSGEHVAFAEISELHRAINALESEVTAQRSRAKKAELEVERLRAIVPSEQTSKEIETAVDEAMRCGMFLSAPSAESIRSWLARVDAAKKAGE